MAEDETPRARLLRARDFKGWELLDPAGEKAGTVAELLLDRQGELRFVDVDFGLLRRHVLVPVRELDWAEQALQLRRWSREQVKQLPPYRPDRPLTDALLEEMERAFPGFYGAGAEAVSAPQAVPLPQAKQFRLEAGAPDPRGWNVFGSDGERVGTVAQVLVDPEALKVSALEVDLLEDLFLLTDDRRVLVPIADVELKERGEDVWVQNRTAAEIARLPAYLGPA